MQAEAARSRARPPRPARRLERLPTRRVLSIEVPVASGYLSRLLGLAWLERERAGAGLLLPDCRGVHTLGMRFALDIVFLGSDWVELSRDCGIGPGRFVCERGAQAVLELPADPARS